MLCKMTVEEREKVELALSWAVEAHRGAHDRNGWPVIMHPLRVALYGDTPDEIVVGLLHDTVEDTEVSLDLIRNAFGCDIADAVDILTNRDKSRYNNYIDNVIESGNKLAIRVKLNDLSHNLDRSIKTDNKELVEKYSSAMEKILKAVGEKVK